MTVWLTGLARSKHRKESQEVGTGTSRGRIRARHGAGPELRRFRTARDVRLTCIEYCVTRIDSTEGPQTKTIWAAADENANKDVLDEIHGNFVGGGVCGASIGELPLARLLHQFPRSNSQRFHRRRRAAEREWTRFRGKSAARTLDNKLLCMQGVGRGGCSPGPTNHLSRYSRIRHGVRQHIWDLNMRRCW